MAQAIAVLRPDQQVLPNHRKLSTTLLDNQYSSLKTAGTSHVAHCNACLVSDAWSNTTNDLIVNYIAVTAKQTVFLESVATGPTLHTAEYIVQDIIQVFNQFNTTFLGDVLQITQQ